MITDYASLQTSIAAWLNRTDMTARIPEFIALAEDEMKRTLRRKKVRATVSFLEGEDAYAIPDAVAELTDTVRLSTSVQSDGLPFTIVTPARLAELRSRLSATGRPRYGSIVGRELLLAPTPDQTYDAEIIYFEAIAPLADGNTTNSVLDEARDVYLFGALVQAEPFLEREERDPVWRSRFDRAVMQLNDKREREEYSLALKQVRLPVVF